MDTKPVCNGGKSKLVISIGMVLPYPVGTQLSIWLPSVPYMAAAATSTWNYTFSTDFLLRTKVSRDALYLEVAQLRRQRWVSLPQLDVSFFKKCSPSASSLLSSPSIWKAFRLNVSLIKLNSTTFSESSGRELWHDSTLDMCANHRISSDCLTAKKGFFCISRKNFKGPPIGQFWRQQTSR